MKRGKGTFGYGRIVALTAIGTLLATSRAWAIINPNFTPLHLIEHAEVVLQLDLRPGKDEETVTGQVVKTFKGADKAPRGPVRVDLADMPEEDAEDLANWAKQRNPLKGLLFIGQGDGDKIYLHAGGQWTELVRGPVGFSGVGKDAGMEATWAGGTDMLARAVDYTLSDPAPDFPVEHGIAWETQFQASKIEGAVRAAIPVRADGGPTQWLYLAAERGDRLFRGECDTFEMKDVTEQTGLRSRSVIACWADFNADGRLDLASWDGQSLTLWMQDDSGRFKARPIDTGAALKNGCMSLSVLDAGHAGGRPALVVGTPDWPVALMPVEEADYTLVPIGRGAFPGKDLGPSAPCLVADFDGDGRPDILQMLRKGGLFYKGLGNGAFADPQPTAAFAGPGAAPFLGDFDGDGRLDVFCPAQDRCRLWQNQGNGAFAEWLDKSGEAAYQCGSGAIGGMTCDFNNDGRQDVLALYDGIPPQLYFNRGFRSFGYSLKLMPTAQTHDGDIRQQVGCMGDFNGNGLQDLALVFRDGQVTVFFQKPGDQPTYALEVALNSAAGYAGPLTLTDYNGDRCLGAWSVTASTEAFIARREAGPVALRWRRPDGKTMEREIILEKPSTRLNLDPRGTDGRP